MSKETSKNFKWKRKKAKLLSGIYYFTGLPFIVHQLLKLFYYLFFRPKFLKSSKNFTLAKRDDLPIDEKGSKGGIGTEFKIFKKIPLLDDSTEKNKFKARWVAKLQNDKHSIREVMTSGVFQLLLGEKHAAKVRLMKDEATGKIYTLSKLFENFQTFRDIFKNKDEKTAAGYRTYMDTTENLAGFKKMLAVSLLLGRNDCHAHNWGVVNAGNDAFVATFDYGVSAIDDATTNLHMYQFLYKQKHCHQHIICEEFVKICEDLIEEFEKNHDEIEALLLEGRAAAQAVYWWWKVPTANEFIDTFTDNKRKLKHLCRHIRAELAILHGDSTALDKALQKLDPQYARLFQTMSLQNRNDFFIPDEKGFISLIQNGYNRVFICPNSRFPSRDKRNQNDLCLSQEDNGEVVVNFSPKLMREAEDLSPKQIHAVKNLINFPEKSTDATIQELSLSDSQKVIACCGYPLKKSKEVEKELTDVFNKYSYQSN